MVRESFEIPVENLRACFDPGNLRFESTEELVSLEGVIGQERAVRAMDFGLHIQDRGYNIFVSGIPGTGKNTLIKSMVKKTAGNQPTPPDWCYVHNFNDPDRPKVLSLPAGEGKNLKQDIGLLIESLKSEFPRVFQSKEFQDQRQEVEEKYGRAKESLTRQLEEQARVLGFNLKTTPMGIVIVPVVEGRPLQPEEVEALDAEKKKAFEKKEAELRQHVHTFAQQVRGLREEMNTEIEGLDRKAAQFISGASFDRLREKYAGRDSVLKYIQEVQDDALNNFRDFLPEPENPLRLAGIEIE
ncbi:MAG TPA: Lon-like protease helical domain-containing protein, partial [Nitrospiria bacterium]